MTSTVACPVCGSDEKLIKAHWEDGADGEECRKKLAKALDERARKRDQGLLDDPSPDSHAAVAGQ